MRSYNALFGAACAFASVATSGCASQTAEHSRAPDPGGTPADDEDGAAQPSKTVAGPCTSAAAGEGFVNITVPSAQHVIVADFTTTPSAAGIDAVHGLAHGAADAYADLAAAFRFAPTGVIEVLDGDAYRADTAFAYEAGTSYDVRVIADLASKTYSVTTMRSPEERVVLAHNYRLADVGALDTLVTIAASGEVSLCGASEAPDVLFRRPGVHAVIPLADGAVISDGATTSRVGTAGETVASFAAGGALAVDDSGNIYIARVTDATLTVDALTPAFAARWSNTYAAPAGSTATAVAVTSAGDVTVLLASGGMLALRSIDAATGASRWTRDLNAVAATPNRAGYALARTTGSSVTVEQLDRDGTRMWARTWPNSVDVQQIATSATGQVIISGAYTGTIDFGGGPIAAHPPGDNGLKNAYVVALSPTGAHVFSQRFGEQTITAIASNGTQTIVAAHHQIGPLITTRYTFDQTGDIIDWREGLAGFGWFGRTYGLAVAESGRVYWSYGPSWPDNFTEWPQLVAY